MSKGNHRCRRNDSHGKVEINRHVSLSCKQFVRRALFSLRHLLMFPVSCPYLQVSISTSALYGVLAQHQSFQLKVSTKKTFKKSVNADPLVCYRQTDRTSYDRGFLSNLPHSTSAILVALHFGSISRPYIFPPTPIIPVLKIQEGSIF
jgi:hypothetical protein